MFIQLLDIKKSLFKRFFSIAGLLQYSLRGGELPPAQRAYRFAEIGTLGLNIIGAVFSHSTELFYVCGNVINAGRIQLQ